MISTATVSTSSSTLGCYFRFNYDFNTVCFHFPGRNTNYTHIFRRHLGIAFDSNTNSALIRFNIDTDPAVCYEAVISVSCLLTSTPCNSENNRTLRICDRSCQAFNRLMASTLCNDFNQQVLNLSTLDSFTPLQQVYRDFDCNDTSTYFFGDINRTQFDDTKCTSIFSMEHEGWFIRR